MYDPTTDPNYGVGGSYELDPVTGVRTLVHRTDPEPQPPPPLPSP